jgi:peptidoglycan/LPS O-acetylase OafA/YrhL
MHTSLATPGTAPAPVKLKFNVGIQLLRGLAALLVVSHHSLEEARAISPNLAPEWLIRAGAGGVDIFFIISGFIIYSVTYGRSATDPERPGVFLLKRFLRIFPIYWICLAATLALWASHLFFRGLHLNAGIVLSCVFLLPTKTQIIGVAWTLVFEMYFYYLFAVSLLLRNARLSVALTAGFILAAIGLSHFLPAGSWQDVLSNPIALEFCFGLVLSHFIHEPFLRGAWLRYLWLPGLVLMGVAAAYAENDGFTSGIAPAVRWFAWGIPALLVAVSFITIPFQKTLFTRLLLPVGNGSYSIYLTHPLMMIGFAFLIKTRLAGFPHPLLLVAVMVATCLAFGLAVHYLVEQPVLARLRARFELSPPMP